MSSKDKSFDKFKTELKQFFKANQKVLAGNATCKFKDEFPFPKEIEQELMPSSPITTRLRTLQNLSEIVLNQKLQEFAVERLCFHTEDILELSPKEYRHTVLYFYQCLVQGQYLGLKMMRLYLFSKIKMHEHHDDTIPKFELFQKLTQNGKDISHFEEEVGNFLLDWMPIIVGAGKALEFLDILVNYIKYNASYIDEDIISGIVKNSAFLCCQSDVEKVVVKSLDVLATIVSYSTISQQTMTVFISALSRTVCLKQYNAGSWKIMRNLLGSHMGHFCLQTICKMLQDDKSYQDIGLVVGMIFNINMALLNNKPDFIIGYIPHLIIPSINRAVHCNNPVVLLEVSMCLRWIIEVYGKELKDPTWDRIYLILEHVVDKISNSPQRDECQSYVDEIFHKIDILLAKNEFKGDTSDLFHLVHRWYHAIPPSLIFRLIDYSATFLIPVEIDWIENLQFLMMCYFEKERRTEVRLHILKMFKRKLLLNRYLFEKSLINAIITPCFSNIVLEKDPVVRIEVIKFLLEFCLECSRVYMGSLLDILEKVLRVPFENEEIASRCMVDPTDVYTVLNGMIDIFSRVIYGLPSSNAIKVLSMLTTFVQNHYKNQHIFENAAEIRWMVIDWLLKLRADSRYRLGYSTPSTDVKFSTFIVIDHRRPSNISLSALSSLDSRSSACSSFEDDFDATDMTYIKLSGACQALVAVLRNERDWSVLKRVLRDLPTALKYKALIVSRYNCDIEPLVMALIKLMLPDENLPEELKNRPTKFSKPEFYCHVIPVLSSLVSHAHMDLSLQSRLISSLQVGIVYKSAHKCVQALTTCLLEMKEAMVKKLPDIILDLSKISPSNMVAIPVLEFLSMLATFPKIFVNFTSKQYMSIFAIIFPYTNPFKYHHYTVSLAHHVIAVWFLRCRRPLRKDFVNYIINGLQTNTPSSFSEMHKKPSDMNEDSSNRKRSSSLTEQGNRERERHMSGSGRLLAPRTVVETHGFDEKLVVFHRDLNDTCYDLMGRFVYVNCSARPRRHPISEFVLHNGQSKQWLLDTSLITITTSGCTQKILRKGLCEKCLESCDFDPVLLPGPTQLQGTSGPEDKDKQIEGTSERNICGNIAEQSPVYGASSRSSPINSNPNVSAGVEDKIAIELKKAGKIISEELELLDSCVCWCQHWAEIHIRRPTGDTSWITRVQNDMTTLSDYDPITDLSALYQATIINELSRTQIADVNVKESVSTEPSVEAETQPEVFAGDLYDTTEVTEAVSDLSVCQDDSSCGRGRNPVQRSKSSPEMSASWKNTYLKDTSRSFSSSPVSELEQCSAQELSPCSTSDCRKTGKCYSKELRGNCEAIPEEFAGQGTTPPKSVLMNLPHVSDSAPVFEALPSSKSGEKSPDSNAAHTLPPSFSDENVNPRSDERRMESHYFDKQSMPNENFEFNRSASVSQVVPPFKKTPHAVSSISLSLTCSQPHLATKPPLSPPTYLSRCVKHGKDSPMDSRNDFFSPLNQDYPRSRVHTISVMSSAKKHQPEWDSHQSRPSRGAELKKSGVNPSYVFLHMYHSTQFGPSKEPPLAVPSTGPIQLAIKNFDRIPPYETHKVGVTYVGPGQANNETEILRNSFGSIRYCDFLCKLGSLVNLLEVNPQHIFLGGLEQNGNDGKWAYVWKDEVMQVIFHVATLMPNKETDVNCNNKKKHIGNDYVTIVFNESGEDYDLHTVKSEFSFASVIIEPLDHGCNQITVKAREDLIKLIGNVEPKFVSDKNVSLLARQLALHINLASVILCRLNQDKSDAGIYASNWLERLRKIKHIRKKVEDELMRSTGGNLNAPSALNEPVGKPYGFRDKLLDFTEWATKQKRENECDDLDCHTPSAKRMKYKNLLDNEGSETSDDHSIFFPPNTSSLTIPVKDHVFQSPHNQEFQRDAIQCNVAQAELVYVNDEYSTLQSNFKYRPDLNAVENPYYYENNKLLFELHFERVQRSGFQSFSSSHQSF